VRRIAGVVLAGVVGTAVLVSTPLAALAGSTRGGGGVSVSGVGSAVGERVTLDGVHVRLAPGTRQVVTVRHTGGWHARVELWRLAGGRWRRVLTTADGRTGAGGLVPGRRRVQGTDATPLGTYRLISAFGTHAHAGHLPYRRIGKGDFWVEDNSSPFYNRWRNQRRGGFRWWLPAGAVDGSERLSDYPRQYEYAVVTSFNVQQVRHRGAGIFLHVNGDGATGGCVSAPRWFLRAALVRLRPGLVPEIAVGR
jgi:L,D-peptidoglycan transpeptidase YkuD (ErfK/YbiS/YcfS/YnhG family)